MAGKLRVWHPFVTALALLALLVGHLVGPFPIWNQAIWVLFAVPIVSLKMLEFRRRYRQPDVQ